MSDHKPLQIMIYDMWAISRFLRSCAQAFVIQQTTSMQWKTNKSSTALNVAYSVLFWKEPAGHSEITVAHPQTVRAKVDQYHLEFLENFLRHLAKNPQSAHEYIKRMERVRESARQAVVQLGLAVGDVNAKASDEIKTGIKILSYVKLGGQIGVAVIGAYAAITLAAAAAAGTAITAGEMSLVAGTGSYQGLGAGALMFTGTGLSHSASHAVIGNFENGPKAQVSALSWEYTKAKASEVGDDALEMATARSLQDMEVHKRALAKLQAKVAKGEFTAQSKLVTSRARRQARKMVAKSSKELAKTNRVIAEGLETAKVISAAGKALPIIFASIDIYEAVKDFQSTMDKLDPKPQPAAKRR